MAETPSIHQPQDIRRAGLNPLSDYGGPEGRSDAAAALALLRKNEESLQDGGQLSFLLEGTVELDKAALPYKRAVLGSAAFTAEQMTASTQANTDVEDMGRDDSSGRSRASQIRQRSADDADIRAQQSRFNGRGPGQ